MNILWLIDKYYAAVEEKEKEALKKEIDAILSRGPLTFKDVATIIAGMAATSAALLILTKVALALIGKTRSST